MKDKKYYENIKVKVKSCDTVNVTKGNHVYSLESLFNKLVVHLATNQFDFERIGEYITTPAHVKLSEY